MDCRPSIFPNTTINKERNQNSSERNFSRKLLLNLISITMLGQSNKPILFTTQFSDHWFCQSHDLLFMIWISIMLLSYSAHWKWIPSKNYIVACQGGGTTSAGSPIKLAATAPTRHWPWTLSHLTHLSESITYNMFANSGWIKYVTEGILYVAVISLFDLTPRNTVIGKTWVKILARAETLHKII